MAITEDLREFAASNVDIYGLLSLPPTAQPSDFDRAWRKAALKYHPDKAGPEFRETFERAEKGYQVLKDPELRALYDSTRAAREQARQREAAFDAQRRTFKEKLNRSEKAAGRPAGALDPEDVLAEKVRRLAEEGKRMRMELDAQLRQEWQDEADRDALRSARKRRETSSAAPAAAAREAPEGNPWLAREPGGLSFAEETIVRLREAQRKKEAAIQA